LNCSIVPETTCDVRCAEAGSSSSASAHRFEPLDHVRRKERPLYLARRVYVSAHTYICLPNLRHLLHTKGQVRVVRHVNRANNGSPQVQGANHPQKMVNKTDERVTHLQTGCAAASSASPVKRRRATAGVNASSAGGAGRLSRACPPLPRPPPRGRSSATRRGTPIAGACHPGKSVQLVNACEALKDEHCSSSKGLTQYHPAPPVLDFTQEAWQSNAERGLSTGRRP
jgi:hypothetical protein